MKEQRFSPRYRVYKAGQILFGPSAMDCTIRNISRTGARIELAGPDWPPERFILAMIADRSAKKCHVVWQSARQFGVSFDN